MALIDLSDQEVRYLLFVLDRADADPPPANVSVRGRLADMLKLEDCLSKIAMYRKDAVVLSAELRREELTLDVIRVRAACSCRIDGGLS